MPATKRDKRDYYEVLGIGRESSGDQVKRAFRTRARVLHPDVSDDPEANDKFAELAEAYDVLSKSTSRLLYDRFGYRGRGEFAAVEPATQQLFDFLETTSEHRRRRSVGEVQLTHYEAQRGATRVVTYNAVETCGACEGTGAAVGASSRPCVDCRGRGRTRQGSTMAGDRVLQIDTCLKCGGTGRTVSESCPACDGNGRSTRRVRTEIAVPPGTVDGQRIVVADSPSPLYVVLRVKTLPDTILIRRRALVGLVVACLFLLLVLRL
jgi:molecular chaperone DnaJ